MFARVTQFEVDILRISLDDALALFREGVLPALHNQPGYMGLYVMRTPEGRGLLLSFWETEEAAQKGVESGYYDEQVSKFMMFTRQPPGRTHYEVVYSETSNVASGSR